MQKLIRAWRRQRQCKRRSPESAKTVSICSAQDTSTRFIWQGQSARQWGRARRGYGGRWWLYVRRRRRPRQRRLGLYLVGKVQDAQSLRFGRDATFILSCNRVACLVDRGSVSRRTLNQAPRGLCVGVQSGATVGNLD
jgi:hypothetical protein